MARDCEQMAQMMQVIMSAITREREIVDDIGSMDTTTLTQEVSKSLEYLATDFAMTKVRIPYCLVPPLSNIMPDPIQSIPNLRLDTLCGSQRQKLSPKQLRFNPIPMPYTELLPILIQSELIISTPLRCPRTFNRRL